MKKLMIVLGLVATMFYTITYVHAQGPAPVPGQKPMGWRGPLQHPEQMTKLRELQRKFNEETAQLRGGILTKKLEAQSLWTNPNADPKAITAKEKELKELQNQITEKAVQYRLEARKLLSSEQVSQWGHCLGMIFGTGCDNVKGDDLGMGMGCQDSYLGAYPDPEKRFR